MGVVLVTGASGMLGSVLLGALRAQGHEAIGLARLGPSDLQVDLLRESEVSAALTGLEIDAIFNLAGLTSVEMCEESPNSAFQANCQTVKTLANWIQSQSPNTHLVQISTDHVYDGNGLHSENDVTIRNTYALTKYAGELEAARVGGTVLRTNFVGKSTVPHRESLTDWVFGSLSRREHVKVLSDVMFSPLAMSTLVNFMIKFRDLKYAGTLNLGSRQGMSKADFDFEFAETLGLDSSFMTPVEADSAKFLRAVRPKNMMMDVSKAEDVLGVTMPSLRDEITKVANEYK